MEVMVAACVIMLVLLTLLGAISFGLEGTRNAAGHQQAVYFARELMELVRERHLAETVISPPNPGFRDGADDRVPLNAAPFVKDFPDNSGYTRRIVTRRASSDPDDYHSRLYEIEITVFWRVKARENNYRLVGIHRVP